MSGRWPSRRPLPALARSPLDPLASAAGLGFAWAPTAGHAFLEPLALQPAGVDKYEPDCAGRPVLRTRSKHLLSLEDMDEADSQGGKRQVSIGPLPLATPAWFLAVGGTATLVHWAVVVSLVEYTASRPLTANVVGWVAAVSVSFVGHHRLSFRGHGAPVAATAWRFLLVSAAGFAVNQAAYAVLLSFTSKSYDLLLGAVLAVVAVGTYVASRWWVFTRSSRA